MIHNIFNFKKKKTAVRKAKILVDVHEKNSLVISELISTKEVDTEQKALEIGDYLIGETIIERKSFQDFVSSMLSKRLIQQLMQMQKYKSKILILEGKDFESLKNTKINPNAIRGMLLSISLDFNVPIIFTKDEEDTAKFLTALAKRQLKNKTEFTLHSRKPATRKEQIQYIVESFPNIGPKTAKLLIKKFNSIKNLINASEEELKAAIGKKADSIISLRG